MWAIVMSPVGSVGGQFVVLSWLFSEKGISVRNDDKAPSQRVVCQIIANGTRHKPYTVSVTCPYYVGFRVNVGLLPWCRSCIYSMTKIIMIIYEIGALIMLVLLIRYLFGCCCLTRRFALPLLMCGVANALINPESFYGGSECFLSGCNRSDNWKWLVTKW